jgi:predicted glycosyltransferase
VKVWIDMTAPAHVLFFRPLIRLLNEQGGEVAVTARRYAETVELLELHGVDADIIGEHAGASRARKGISLVDRLGKLRRWARGRGFDLALAHGSHELTMTARRLGIPSSTSFDYEFATLQHHLGCRAANRVVVPDAIPPERLARFGARPPKLAQYPGLKEEYYLHDWQPSPLPPELLPANPEQILVVLRTPPDVSLYHRRSNPLFIRVLQHLGTSERVHGVVLPRTTDQRELVRSLDLPSIVVADHAVDAQSLIAAADLVISAGGTMNREAAALGVPVYSTYGGRLGGVDEALMREGRLRPLSDPRALKLRKRDAGAGPVKRDPSLILELMIEPAAGELTDAARRTTA